MSKRSPIVAVLTAFTLSLTLLTSGCMSGGGNNGDDGGQTISVKHTVPDGEPLAWQHDVTDAQRSCKSQGHTAPTHQQTCGATPAPAAAAPGHPSTGSSYSDGSFRSGALYPGGEEEVNAAFGGLVINELARTDDLHRAQSTTRVRAEQLRQLDQVRAMAGSGANGNGQRRQGNDPGSND